MNAIKVRLHSNDKKAAEATDSTLRMLPGGASLERDEYGEVRFDEDGYAYARALDAAFISFAIQAQGYVKEVHL